MGKSEFAQSSWKICMLKLTELDHATEYYQLMVR